MIDRNLISNVSFGAATRVKTLNEALAKQRPDLITVNETYLKSEDLYSLEIRYKNSRLGEHRRIFCKIESVKSISVKKRLFDNSDKDCSFTSFQSFIEFIFNSFPKVSNIRENLYYDL